MEEDALEDEERTEDKANSSLASSVAEPEVEMCSKGKVSRDYFSQYCLRVNDL
jgi:hypothetical protein